MKKNSIIKDSFYLTVVKIVTSITGMVQTMILTKTLSEEEIGTYNQGLLLINLVAQFSILGLADAVNYFYNKENIQEDKKKYVNTIFGIQCLIGFVAGIGMLIFRDVILSYIPDSSIKPFFIYIVFRPLLINLISMFQVLYISDDKAKVIMWRNLLISLFQVGIVSLLQFFQRSITTLFVMLLILDIIQLLFFSAYFFKNRFIIQIYKIKQYKEVLKWSIPVAMGIILSNLMHDIDKLYVVRILSEADYGIYSTVARPLPFSLFTAAIATVIAPYTIRLVSQKKNEEAKSMLSSYYQLAYTISFTLAIGAIACAPEIIRFLYRKTYLEGINIFNIYVIVAALNFAFFGLLLTAVGKTKWLMVNSFIGLILNIILNIVFYNYIGIEGPGLATLVCTILLNMMQLKRGLKEIDGKLFQVLKIKYFVLLIIKLIIAGIISLLIKRYLLSINMYFVIVLIITYSIYLLLALLLNFKKLKTLTGNIRNISK